MESHGWSRERRNPEWSAGRRVARAVRCRAFAAGLLALLAAGCADGRGIIGPAPPLDIPFDPRATANSIYSLRFAADNAIVVQVRTISEALGLSDPAANRVAHSRTRGTTDRLGLLRTLAPGSLERGVANVAAARARGAKVPLFPINYLGKEFIFDAGIDAYVEVGEGGPENGVRFELYVVDLSSGLPAAPAATVRVRGSHGRERRGVHAAAGSGLRHERRARRAGGRLFGGWRVRDGAARRLREPVVGGVRGGPERSLRLRTR